MRASGRRGWSTAGFSQWFAQGNRWRLWAEAALLLLINKRFEKLFRGPPGTAGFSSLPGCHHIWVGSECSSFLSQTLRFPLHLPHFFWWVSFSGRGGGRKYHLMPIPMLSTQGPVWQSLTCTDDLIHLSNLAVWGREFVQSKPATSAAAQIKSWKVYLCSSTYLCPWQIHK